VSHSHARWAGSLAAAGFCAIGIGWTWNSLKTPGPTPEQIRLEEKAQALQLTQAQKQAQIDEINTKLDGEWHFDRSSTWLRLLVIAGLATLTVSVPAGAVAGGMHLWHNRDMPDKATGAIAYRNPSAQDRIAINMAAMQTRNLLATNPALPSGLTNLHTVHSPRNIGTTPEPELVVTNPEDVKVPTVTDLLRRREIGPGQLLALGWDPETKALRRSEPTEDGDLFAALYSAGMGGHQGSGKSRDAEWLCIQAALIGTGLRLCDGHGRISAKSLTGRLRPLEAAFIRPIALDHEDILLAMRETVEEIERRLRLGIEDGQPQLTVVDEWRRVIGEDSTGEIAEHAGTITREGRKVKINGLFISQTWSKRESGPFRNQLAAAFIHRMRPDEARMLVPGVPNDTLRLAQGECYVIPTSGETHRLWVPRVDDAAIALAGQMLGGNGRLTVGNIPTARLGNGAGTAFPRLGTESTVDAFPAGSEGVPEIESAVPRARPRACVEEALREKILGMLHAGSTTTEIARELYPPLPTQTRLTGHAYERAMREIHDVLSDATRPTIAAEPTLTVLPIENDTREGNQ
jgi:hypothetical protein